MQGDRVRRKKERARMASAISARSSTDWLPARASRRSRPVPPGRRSLAPHRSTNCSGSIDNTAKLMPQGAKESPRHASRLEVPATISLGKPRQFLVVADATQTTLPLLYARRYSVNQQYRQVATHG